ncbi:polymorphic toxin type 50 domain-containing protein [Enterococcus sp. 2201sp1_2201st1_B8_2201SCRN_220225]|uniref:polymorphic toxin type 50 domain-containing protein n=2 Tax=unclassified Enterococcus TaxID=2608891 RepID=UPI0034A30EC8
MTKKNKLPYWKRRMLRIAQMRDAKDQEYIQKMVKEYDRLSNRMYKEIQGWMDRYADNEGITPDEAYQQLSKDEQLTWTMTLKEFRQKAIEGGYDQELNREYFKSRITRLEQLERQLYFELAEAANNQEAAMRTYLKDTLNETYLRHIYEMTDRGAFSIAFDRFSTEALELAIMKPWKGSNFSRRVWGNHLNHIPDKLSKTMSVAISQGWGIDRTVKEMMQGVDSSLKNRMTTLVQTESAHIAEVANDRAMEQTGVEKWEWLATLEIHTCARCAGLDGQEFDADDETAPNCPDHPNCRCTRVPVIAGWKSSSRWQRDPITGKGKVGPNITFDEWRKDKVTPEVERDLKIERAVPSDKKQYDRYKSVLGSELLPKKFADFQDLKYNKSEEWTKTNLAYRDEILKNKIRSGSYNLTIHEGRQGKHILGHANYKDGKSYLLDVINPQELVKKYAGTGEIQRRRGKWTNKELIIIDEFIGVNSSLDGTMPFTNRFQIHYSKAGVHIVPTLKGVKTSES